MKTTAVYHGFAMQHEQLNNEILQRVLQIVPINRLYLLGLTTTSSRTETLFSVQSATRTEVKHYYLMALVEKKEEHTISSIQDKIESRLQHFLRVTAIVLSVVQFSKWLIEGHPFAAAIYDKAFLLYQCGDMSLPLPAAPNKEVIKKEAEQLFKQTKAKVQEFLAGAELYTIRVQYKMAAFMLHQAAEQALRTMLIINTGLRINTHSIDRLVRYSSMFTFELQDIFPRNSEKQTHLFKLLQNAYIDTRYKEDYYIRLDDLIKLRKQVEKLFYIFINFRNRHT